jgi:hypothetical protein
VQGRGDPQQQQQQQQLARDIPALAAKEEGLQMQAWQRQAAHQAELQHLSAGLVALRLQIQQEHERQVQAFDQQWSLNQLRDWASHDAALAPRQRLVINGRSRGSVLAEQAALVQTRDQNLQLAQQRYDADLRDCGQCWQRDRAQLVQDIQRVQRRRELAAQQYQAMLA